MSADFTLNSYVVAAVEIGSNRVTGNGRAELPVLIINLRIVFPGRRNSSASLNFREFSCCAVGQKTCLPQDTRRPNSATASLRPVVAPFWQKSFVTMEEIEQRE